DPRIKEAASGGAENTVTRVHDDLDGVRERRIFFGFGFIPCVRQMFNQLRQNMIFPREERAVTARHNLFVCERAMLCNPDSAGGEQKGAHDARIQALKLEHEYVVVDSRT